MGLEEIAHLGIELVQRGGDDKADAASLGRVSSLDAQDGALNQVEAQQWIAPLELHGQRGRRALEDRAAGGIEISRRDGMALVMQRTTDLAIAAGVGTLQGRHDDVQRRPRGDRLSLRSDPRVDQPAHARRRRTVTKQEPRTQFGLPSQRQARRRLLELLKLDSREECVVTTARCGHDKAIRQHTTAKGLYLGHVRHGLCPRSTLWKTGCPQPPHIDRVPLQPG